LKLKTASSDPFVAGVIHAAAGAASEQGGRAYLVGGPVRDTLLGLAYSDVDLMSIESAEAVAKAVARATGGRIRSFPQFLTFKIVVSGHPAVDVTTARSETYRKPGSLPSVSHGSVRDDLFRRDFTVNAMALDLHDGNVIDPFDGRKDLQARVLRILHDRSFIDDPTRILRGLRLSARLDLKFEPHTRALLDDAIRADALAWVSRERLWRELFLALEEPDPGAAVCAIADAGALARLTGLSRCSDQLRGLLSHLARWSKLHPIDLRAAAAAALLRGDPERADEHLAGTGFSSIQRRNIASIVASLQSWAESLERDQRPREQFASLRALTPEALAMLAGMGKRQQSAVEAFTACQATKLGFRGGDLGVPPGPHIARAIEETREALYLRELTPSEARAFARKLALSYLYP
jgi:tRNA nucleotidyltransferase (CCA-adding enzyme)